MNRPSKEQFPKVDLSALPDMQKADELMRLSNKHNNYNPETVLDGKVFKYSIIVSRLKSL